MTRATGLDWDTRAWLMRLRRDKRLTKVMRAGYVETTMRYRQDGMDRLGRQRRRTELPTELPTVLQRQRSLALLRETAGRHGRVVEAAFSLGARGW
jgi:hypothetical protein